MPQTTRELKHETTPRSLAEFFVIHQADNPVGDEVARLTLIGSPVGALYRAARRFRNTMVALVVSLVWLDLNAWVSSVIVFATLAVSIATRPSRDYPVGVLVSDRRVVTAQMRARGQAPIATEYPAGAVTSATVMRNLEKPWLVRCVYRVTFTGPSGTIAVVEGSRLNPRVMEILCNQAQIDVTYPPSPPPTRWWLPKAFVVVMLFIVGLTMTLIAGITLTQQRDMAAFAMTSIGIAITVVSEGLRRLLLRREP
jgi:hypothetical protein